VLRREERLEQGVTAKVMDIWRERVDAFLALPSVRSLNTALWREPVDDLRLLLTLSKHERVLDIASRLPTWLQRMINGDDSYATSALTEAGIKDGSRQFAVYGHTHHAEVVPLSAVDDGAVAYGEQLELNSGTWRCVHERCIGPGQQLSFSASHVLTWLTFYRGDERKGRRYETRSGQLDIKRRSDGARAV